MRVLVTGCCGFIGFFVSKRLLERGDSVIGIDSMNDYYDVSLKESRLKILNEHNNFVFLQKDISEGIDIDDKVDAVCHLAAQAGVRYSIMNPLAYEKSNMLGTLQVLEFSRHNNISNTVVASSSSVYGDNKNIPFNESLDVSRPVSLYAATKRANELYCYTYHHLYNLNITCLRFFTVYGPYGRPDMAYFSFLKNIIEDKKISVFNHGKLSRDFTYISDIVDGVVNSIDKPLGYEIINLGRSEPVLLMDFINEIEKAVNKKAIIEYKDMQPGDVHMTFADTSKARNLLGYEPKISLAEGIKQFVEWYKIYYS